MVTFSCVKFPNAFKSFKNSKEETRYRLNDEEEKVTMDITDKKVVKIAGKNGIPHMMAEFQPEAVMEYVFSLAENPKKNIVIVFDGDNLEPDRTPFSVLISKLAASVHAIVAVKKNPKDWGYSQAFVKGWEHVPNMFLVQVNEDSYEWNKRLMNETRVYHVVNVYSNIEEFRFRKEGGETTGYKQLKEQIADEKDMRKEIHDIVYGVTAVKVVKNE